MKKTYQKSNLKTKDIKDKIGKQNSEKEKGEGVKEK